MPHTGDLLGTALLPSRTVCTRVSVIGDGAIIEVVSVAAACTTDIALSGLATAGITDSIFRRAVTNKMSGL
jgi:hypothetical protein